MTADTTTRAPRGRRRPTPAFLLTLLILLAGLTPLPRGSWARWARQSARSLEPNHADRKATEAGYYEGLINVGHDGSRDDLARRLLGEPSRSDNFHDLGATRYMPSTLLQFELVPGVRRAAFGESFTTNAFGLRDRPTTVEKPEGVFRIALLGSSIDMGWGVPDDKTYENRLENWLNAQAQRRGLDRRFEVLNFSMAAYSPLHRLETFRRKAAAFRPDVVLYSATLLDERLLQIHLSDILRNRLDPRLAGYPDLAEAFARAGIAPEDVRRKPDGDIERKDALKAKLQPQLGPIIDSVLRDLAAESRGAGAELLAILIPRAGTSDSADVRGPDVARYASRLAGRGIDTLDLSTTFDDYDPADVSIAPWDDHPNKYGHKLLCEGIAHAILERPELDRLFFGNHQ